MTRGKMIDENTLQGDAGVALIHRRVSQMKHVWHERHIDPGIDGTIELRDPDTGEMSNQHIFVQSKTTRGRFPGEDDTGFHFLCDERDIDYWMKAGHNPVILVCSKPETGDAWWAHIQQVFGDAGRRATRRVEFDKTTQKFDQTTAARLLVVADPHARAHSPVAEHRAEKLISNLMPVDFPHSYFSAMVPTSNRGAVLASQRETGKPIRHDFYLANGRIYTCAPIAGTSLARIAMSAANEYPVGDLRDGTPERRRLLTGLLNAALRHDLREICGWSNSRKFVYFKAPENLQQRKVTSATGRPRIAFNGYYQSKDDPSRREFYRHAALRWNFTEIAGDWFCAVTPDYYFTTDGQREHPFAEKYLATLKRRERNGAVLGETQLWFGLLQPPAEPVLHGGTDDEKILTFGKPLVFDSDFGIDDDAWDAPGVSIVDDDQLSLDFGDDE